MPATAAAKKKAAPDFDATFAALKRLLAKHARKFNVTQQTPVVYTLVTKTDCFRGKPVWFGCVRRGKAYVSYHLVALYAFPELLKKVPPELKKRMQGKACFNFTAPDAKLFRELDKVTAAGLARFRKEKWA